VLQTTLTVALDDGAGRRARAAGRCDCRLRAPGVRLEYLLVPLVFGLGRRWWRWSGTNIGAGQGSPRACASR